MVKTDPAVKVEPGLEPSPNPESKLDVPDDDEEGRRIDGNYVSSPTFS